MRGAQAARKIRDTEAVPAVAEACESERTVSIGHLCCDGTPGAVVQGKGGIGHTRLGRLPDSIGVDVVPDVISDRRLARRTTRDAWRCARSPGNPQRWHRHRGGAAEIDDGRLLGDRCREWRRSRGRGADHRFRRHRRLDGHPARVSLEHERVVAVGVGDRTDCRAVQVVGGAVHAIQSGIGGTRPDHGDSAKARRGRGIHGGLGVVHERTGRRHRSYGRGGCRHLARARGGRARRGERRVRGNGDIRVGDIRVGDIRVGDIRVGHITDGDRAGRGLGALVSGRCRNDHATDRFHQRFTGLRIEGSGGGDHRSEREQRRQPQREPTRPVLVGGDVVPDCGMVGRASRCVQARAGRRHDTAFGERVECVAVAELELDPDPP